MNDSRDRQSAFQPFARALLGSFVVVSALAATANCDDWPQFLGPQRNGISAEKGLLDSWPAGGPRELWRVNGGVGMSGVAISGGRLVTLVQRDGQQQVLAMDARTGEELWRTPVAPEYKNSMGDGPRATPAISDSIVYVFTGEGILAALQLADGKQLFSANLVERHRGRVAEYGMACSPLVVENRVIVAIGAPNAAVVACDTKTGKTSWQAGDGPAGYSSPALLNLGGAQQAIAFIGDAVLGLAPQSGQELWRYPYVTNYECNIATPLAYEGGVFISSGENHGSELLALKKEGEVFRAEPRWQSHGPRSVMRNEWQTSMLLDGYLYGFDNVGGAGPVSHFNCVNIATGERVWQEIRFGKGNLIAADGKLWMSSMKGELIVARATPEKYEELGRAVVIGRTRHAPALANGLLYLRDDREIVCLDVRGK